MGLERRGGSKSTPTGVIREGFFENSEVHLGSGQAKNVFNSCRKFLGERKYKLIWRGSLELELLERTLGEKTEGRYWEDLELSPFFLSLFGWLHLVN